MRSNKAGLADLKRLHKAAQATQAARKQRLAEHFDMTQAELARLHGPVGLRLGAKTPAEIAVSILAEIVQVKNAQVVHAHSASSCATPGVAAG